VTTAGWNGKYISGSTALSASTWYHTAFTVDGSGNLNLYLNGVSVATTVTGATSPGANYVQFLRNAGSGSYVIDEAKVSTVPRSATWLLTEYNNQRAPASFLALGPFTPVTAASSGYAEQSVITLGNSSQIPASQTNFTVLVCANMTLGNGNACATATGLKVTGSGGYVTSSSGYDIVFSSTACTNPTLMSWEMVTYTGSTGAMEAWVKVPSLAAGGVFYACVGNSAVTTFQGGAAGAAWTSSYATVWHLQALSASDSTTNANTGTATNSPTVAAAQIDNGLDFTASSSQYVFGANTVNSSPQTLSVWVYLSAYPAAGALVAGLAQGNRSNTSDHFLWISSSGYVSYYVYNGAQYNATSSTLLPINQWNHIVGAVGAGGQFIYQNGVQVGTNANTAG
jgi:hypothetical protein